MVDCGLIMNASTVCNEMLAFKGNTPIEIELFLERLKIIFIVHRRFDTKCTLFFWLMGTGDVNCISIIHPVLDMVVTKFYDKQTNIPKMTIEDGQYAFM